MARQRDLFQDDEQADLGKDALTLVYRPDPDRVRAPAQNPSGGGGGPRTGLPWEPPRVSLYRTIFRQMTLWLPEDEGAQLRFEFDTELARLGAA
ncbi:MAG: hypothetical protein R3D52_11540 [Xanthobacteraceae bacterium]